jgi:hypothetical protein
MGITLLIDPGYTEDTVMGYIPKKKRLPFIHTYNSLFIPEGVAEASQKFLEPSTL